MYKIDRENIECYTPKYAIDILIPYLKKDLTYWAPFSKDQHNFANYLREKGFKIINTHIEDKVPHDFLKYTPEFHFDAIIDNPPFKGKTDFVKRAMYFNKPFALFLPVSALSDSGIHNQYVENNVEMQLLIPKQRSEFHNQLQKGISFKTIFYCKGILPKQIILIQ